MLEKNPKNRFSAKECLEHPWIKQSSGNRNSVLDEETIKKILVFE